MKPRVYIGVILIVLFIIGAIASIIIVHRSTRVESQPFRTRFDAITLGTPMKDVLGALGSPRGQFENIREGRHVIFYANGEPATYYVIAFADGLVVETRFGTDREPEPMNLGNGRSEGGSP